MSLFIITFLVLYGGVHLYALFKVKHALNLGVAWLALFAGFMIVMVAAPVLVRVSERHGQEVLARFLAHVGYTWMGLLFLFFATGLALDLYHCAAAAYGKVSGRDVASLLLSPKASLAVLVGIATAASVYGAFEARRITAEHVVVPTAKLPSGYERVRIVQISDVHLGLLVRQSRFRRIIEQVRKAEPDVLVSTGDFVDGQIDGLADIARMLADINPPLGKFAVTGNHEYYAGLRQSLLITETAGFRILRGEGTVVGDVIAISGVDDPVSHRGEPAYSRAETAMLRTLPRDRFVVLLKHRPSVERESLGLFDLQLSGHVHKGQIFPFNLLTHLFYPVSMGLSPFPNNSLLYVSRGSGTWGPPMRVAAPPEVTIIDVVRAPVTSGH